MGLHKEQVMIMNIELMMKKDKRERKKINESKCGMVKRI